MIDKKGGEIVSETKPQEKKGFIQKFAAAGNKVPNPIVLFLWAILIVLVLAAIFSGTEFLIPGAEDPSKITSLFNAAGLQYILTSLFSNFSSMSIIPILIAMAAAVGIGEKAGFWEALIVRCFKNIPDKLLIFLFLFICINGNLMSDASLIIFPTLGAILFQSRKRSPLLGITLAYCGYLGGLSANVLLASTDANVSALTETAMQTLDITRNLTITVASNWLFMAVSAVMLAAVGTFVTLRFVEPAISKEPNVDWNAEFDPAALEVTRAQTRGLRAAGITALVYIGLVLVTVVPKGGILRNAVGGILPKSPFMSSIVPLLAILFALLGIVYGKAAKTLHGSQEVISAAIKGINSITSALLAIFVVAQFNAYLTKTNLASYLAVSGANWLKSMNMSGIPTIVALVIFVMLLNFIAGSVSSKWAMISTIIVPMMALLGYHPAYAQCVYRVGDALTNSINPIMYYIPMILAVFRKYKKDAGIGTVVAYQFPFFVAFFILWTLMLILWFLTGWPLGPGGPVFIN